MNTSWKPWEGVSFYKQSEKRAAELKRARERVLGMMDGLAAPKMTPLMKMSRSR